MTIKDSKIIKLDNSLTLANVADLKAKLLKYFEQKVKKLVLDFGKVDTVDSVGLGLILATRTTLKNSERTLELINVSKDIYDFFHVMRLNQYFEIQGS